MDERDGTPLMLTDEKGDEVTAMYLLRTGANCEGLPEDRVNSQFRHTGRKRDLAALRTLLENDRYSERKLSRAEFLHLVRNLSKQEIEELFINACPMDDVLAVHAFLEEGCSVTCLSREKQKEILLHACREGDFFVALTLLKSGCKVSILSIQEQETLLCHACRNGSVFVVELLLANGCNMNCLNSNGDTPLTDAILYGHEEVVKKLILAGANLGMQDAGGETALHIAATCNRIQCGILLAEGGASVRTKNGSSLTPLDIARPDFKEAIKQTFSFTTRKAICVIGNSEAGKSTLIAALQAESNSILGKIGNRFRKVSDYRQRTAGIEIIPYCSQKYGEVLFFDFAGQDDYHGPHQMFLQSLLSKPGVSMHLLLVVKTTEEEDAVLHQLHRWLSPVALMATPASPPHIIIIGSFIDKVTSKEEANAKMTRCIEATKKDMEELPLQFLGSSFLNCRRPQSKGIDRICNFLQEIPIPEFRATHTNYSLAWVLYQIRLSIKVQAVQLQEFSIWVQVNEDSLPETMPSPEEVCKDLSAAGHALYIPNKDQPRSWLVLDIPGILHDVYGTLFSKSTEIMGNKFGLLHCDRLAEFFPNMDIEMIQQFLISLEFCLPVDPSILKVEASKLTETKKSCGWLFFPALISKKLPQPVSEGVPRESVHYLCWQLRTFKKHSISAQVLQTILLRLADHFVVKHCPGGVQQHCCNIWWNGIAWQSKKDVDVTVYTANNRVIHVIGASLVSAEKLCQYLIDVISDILSVVHQFSPKLAADSYIVHPPIISTSYKDVTTPPSKDLFPVVDIQNSIEDHEEFTLSLNDSTCNCCTRAMVPDLFGGYTPSLVDIWKINWPHSEANPTKPTLAPSQTKLNCEQHGLLTESNPIPSGAQALLNVSSTPDMRDVDELLVTEIAANWQKVALRLDVEGCVSEIVLKNNLGDCEGACRDILDRWLRGERRTGEKERTWSTLLTALSRAGFVELERRLLREHFNKSSSFD